MPDHFAHPEFRTEWWYYTGNLRSANHEFGFELTFFRERIRNSEPNPSRWRIEHLYVGHFAVTEITAGRFRFAQQMHRGALGLAGARTGSENALPRVWVRDWSADIAPDVHRLRAADGEIGIALELRPEKPAVLHGRDGISRKGAAPEAFSHYYSYTRMAVSGTLRAGGRDHKVSGLSWMDHEFSNSLLSKEQAGWDWLSLQFDGGAELMLYQFRRRDGARDPFSAGTWIPAHGSAQPIDAAGFRMTSIAGVTWTSPRSRGTYPLRWRVEVPAFGIDVEVRATVPGQELVTAETTGVNYWEGAVRASGRVHGGSTSAVGYLEMTGYAPGWLGGGSSGLRQ